MKCGKTSCIVSKHSEIIVVKNNSWLRAFADLAKEKVNPCAHHAAGETMQILKFVTYPK